MVVAISRLFRLSVNWLVLASTPSAFLSIWGICWFKLAVSRFKSWLVLVRFAVIWSTWCRELAIAGSANRVFTLAKIESSLGNICCICGIMPAACPKAPNCWPPQIVSPEAMALAEPNLSSTFTFPIMSVHISALLSAGTANLLSILIWATISPVFW